MKRDNIIFFVTMYALAFYIGWKLGDILLLCLGWKS